ncbi:MAG TPA: DUF4266 domain-containing protein [Fibrobacteria bacterium]|nr:DUF4266 domain-containing protein [Fibrobacteria bacterium]
MKPRLRAAPLARFAGAALALALGGCAAVKPFEREKLADPIMDPAGHFSKQTLEQKFFSTREGSIGGGGGVGGGCGCSK